MKTTCPHCQKKAVIYDTEAINHQRSRVFLQCSDIRQCGARSRFELSIKKALKRSLLADSEQLTHPDGLVSADFRINCPHCANPAVIYSRYNVTAITADLYCRCSDKNCQARLVVDFAYHATVLPPIGGVEQLAWHIVKNAKPRLAPEFQADLFGVCA